jgi:hypothetical protein
MSSKTATETVANERCLSPLGDINNKYHMTSPTTNPNPRSINRGLYWNVKIEDNHDASLNTSVAGTYSTNY